MEHFHYALIEKVISQDTIVQDWQKRIYRAKVSNGTLEPKDTISFVKSIKNQKLRLYSESLNQSFINKLLENENKHNHLTNWIGSKLNQDILNMLPSRFEFDKKYGLKGIEIIDENSVQDSYHRFSTPIEIKKNVFLVYWLKHNGFLNSSYQFIKYSVHSDGNVVILGYYPMGIS